jgi:hypothetical protein
MKKISRIIIFFAASFFFTSYSSAGEVVILSCEADFSVIGHKTFTIKLDLINDTWESEGDQDLKKITNKTDTVIEASINGHFKRTVNRVTGEYKQWGRDDSIFVGSGHCQKASANF